MTNKENYDLVEDMLNSLWDRWRDYAREYELLKEEEINEFEDARNALQNLLIAADKNG